MTERFLKTWEVAEMLGYHAGTIQDWAEKRGLPSFRPVGGHLRFRESEVLAWLEMQRKNGPVAGGEVSPTPTAEPTRGVVSQLSPTPLRGERDAS